MKWWKSRTVYYGLLTPDYRVCLNLLELGVALDEFFCAAAGEADADAAVVIFAFYADDDADSVFGMAHLLAQQRIGVCTAPDFRNTKGRRRGRTPRGVAGP